MNVVGLSCYYHDAAAALVIDGQVVAAAEEERFTRVKHDSRFPARALAFCLEQAALTPRDVDAVVFYEKPLTKLHRMVRSARTHPPESWASFTRRAVRHRHEGLSLDAALHAAGIAAPVWYTEHHVAHGASAFFCSPFEDAAVVTLDGVGELATATIGVGHGASYQILAEQHYPHSLGLFYSAMTAFLGFAVNSDEYKVMGLASYGRPRFADALDQVVHIADNGAVTLDLDYFTFHTSDDRMYGPRLEALLGPAHPVGAAAGQREMDIAASVQATLERGVLAMLQEAHARTGLPRVCLAGGVALNGVANWRAFSASPFTDIFIPPSAGDSGGAIGAALYAYHTHTGARTPTRRFSPYQGPAFSDHETRLALDAAGLDYRELDPAAVLDETAAAIADDRIVGWFQGRMEFGPRALGARSILANPRRADMKDTINACVKFREEFRPFAPAVLADRAEEYFALGGHEAPYMVLVPDAVEGAADRIPAVVHVDNTARVQTVTPDLNPRFHGLLAALDARTGVPVVLNTSFNVKGEPIVCSPTDAIRCFLNTDIDVLAINNFLVTKDAL